MTLWILTIVVMASLIAIIVIDEIRFDRELERYQRDRDARIRAFVADISSRR